MGIFRIVDQLTKGLDGATLRHNVLSNNLANVNTPGFKRSDVDFQGQLKRHLCSSNTRFSPSSQRPFQFVVEKDRTTIMRNDGNNVDPDREMVLLLENQIQYQAIADVLNRQLSLLKLVIGEGRR
ncbi:MAG: flagellar basal body rod protein FlgB [Firmicutes bacterium]|nr:flagellar basal body rod protein FlgB [Bacillota bacterium]